MNKSNPKLLPAAVALSLLFGAVLVFGDEPEKPDGAAQKLRCEYLVNPLGIDVERPRLSWMLNATTGVRGQSAYRVLVASRRDVLQKDQGDLWDSGRVT